MISASGNIEDLLHALSGCPLTEVIERVTAEKRAAEAAAKNSAEPVRGVMFDCVQSCRCLKWWLTTRNRPRNCNVFPLFKGLTVALVDNGGLPATMLTAFV